MVYILAVVWEYMMFDIGPLSNLEEQWFISCNNNPLNFSVDACVKLSIYSFLRNIFVNYFTKGGQDDR